MAENNNQSQSIKPVEFEAELSQTRPFFSNSTNAHYSYEQWLLDFLYRLNDQATLISRVVITPSHVKNLNILLSNQIKEYEALFGEIRTEAQ